MTTEQFAGRLKELRQAAGMTQKQLADKAGLALSTVTSLEQGLYDATWPTALALLDALGVGCEELRKPPSGQPTQGRGRPPKATPATPPAQDLIETRKQKKDADIVKKPKGPTTRKDRS